VFSPGQVDKSIQLQIADDPLTEPAETVVLKLGSPTNATLGPTASETITINASD
jgi:hypothetical protein